MTTTTTMVMMLSITMTLTITTLAVQYSVLYIRTNYVRPHRMHIVHAAYCYRFSSVVSVCVCLNVRVLVTTVSSAETDKPIAGHWVTYSRGP